MVLKNETKDIYIEKVQRSVFELYRRYKNNEILLSSEDQRNDIWSKLPARQSKLIESILLSIPIPVIYLSESLENTYEVVDGQQRLNTFFSFMDNKFKLKSLSLLTELDNKYFKNLSPNLQRKLEDYSLIIFIIKKNTHPDIKFDIFERVNIDTTNYRKNFNEK